MKENKKNKDIYELNKDQLEAKVHPDAVGAKKSSGKQNIGRSKGG